MGFMDADKDKTVSLEEFMKASGNTAFGKNKNWRPVNPEDETKDMLKEYENRRENANKTKHGTGVFCMPVNRKTKEIPQLTGSCRLDSHLLWQRYQQLALLAEVSGFIAFFQMIVLYGKACPLRGRTIPHPAFAL